MSNHIIVGAPSDLMSSRFPALHSACTQHYGILEMPRAKAERCAIEFLHINRLQVLACFQAARHRDDEFGWTALWTIQSKGHILCVQPKTRAPIDREVLEENTIVIFNAKKHWHWTERSGGLYVAAPVEFKALPTIEQAQSAIDAALMALSDA